MHAIYTSDQLLKIPDVPDVGFETAKFYYEEPLKLLLSWSSRFFNNFFITDVRYIKRYRLNIIRIRIGTKPIFFKISVGSMASRQIWYERSDNFER